MIDLPDLFALLDKIPAELLSIPIILTARERCSYDSGEIYDNYAHYDCQYESDFIAFARRLGRR